MTDQWLRKDAQELAESARQLGLTPDRSRDALQVGARVLAHLRNPYEIEESIRAVYRMRAQDDRAVETGTATPFQYRRWKERLDDELHSEH